MMRNTQTYFYSISLAAAAGGVAQPANRPQLASAASFWRLTRASSCPRWTNEGSGTGVKGKVLRYLRYVARSWDRRGRWGHE